MYINSGNDIYIRPQGSENGIKVIGDGAAELYHNNVKKVETTSYGAQVSGNLVVGTDAGELLFSNPDGFSPKLKENAGALEFYTNNALAASWGTGGNLAFQDNKKVELGTGADLQIYHDGTHNQLIASSGYIKLEATTNDLYLRGNTVWIQSGDGNETFAKLIDNGAVELYWDNAKKFETYEYGIRTTQNIDIGLHAAWGDNGEAIFGAGSDLKIYHDGTHSYLKEAGTGNFYVMASTKLQIDNSAGDKTMAAFHDGGAVELYHNNVKKIETGQQYNYVYAVASGNPAGLAVRNMNDASDYSHAELRLESKNNAAYSSLYTDKANASLRLGYNTTGATFNVFNDGTVRSAGIKFGSDTAAANALDDYEEGTWTPNPLFGSTDAGESVDANGGNAGYYTKIGRLVYCHFTTNFSGRSGSASGVFKLDGLPFAISANNWNEDGGQVHYFTGLTNAGGNVSVMCENTNKIQFKKEGNDTWSENEVGTGAIRIRGSLTYHTAA